VSKDRVTRRQKSIPRLLREKKQIHKDKLKVNLAYRPFQKSSFIFPSAFVITTLMSTKTLLAKPPILS
jgi:hypothetical protein